MFKKLPLATLITSLVIGLSACSKPEEKKEAPAEATATAPSTLHIGSDLTYPPYGYFKDNQPQGFDVELLGLLANANQQKPEFVDTRFASLIPSLNSKKFDVIASSMFITPEREKQVNFIPYAKVGNALIVRTGEGFAPKDPKDLCGKTLSILKGSAGIPKLDEVSKDYCAANNKKGITIREFDTSPEALQSLLAKSSDVQFDDTDVAKGFIAKVNGKVMISTTEPLYPQTLGIAVRKDDAATLASLTKALETIKGNQEYQKLLDKYGIKGI
ncbi:ABC transporter substrate-binding protein [Acinetobacter rathckeae]|uniref:ABC transporter substrate-binding protein n=1 Tax=Acinetobacter rathckeae TaxID=2605272 RepID=UPI0018A28628|nr:ABC transporter substrate-binding protein [Acinetobacter rathckeae]MBF7688973.1 ABC transporter substrate-binding protein [Acinetobacter rathckeae]MBF7696372.1 ABC transporter substrate-binding protein [Acinetobacter rathckeae]